MDLHRLRVVEFDTSVREKEREKNHISEFEKCKKQERKISTVRTKDGIGYENHCLNENRNPLVPSKKSLGEEISPPGTSKKCLGDTSSPAGAIKVCVNDEGTPPRISKQLSDDKLGLLGTPKKYMNDTAFTSYLGTSKNQRSKSEIFKIPPKKKPRKRTLRINSSDLGLKKNLQDSASSLHKKRTLNVRNRGRNAGIHHKEENVKGKKEKSEEVHFLFARGKPSFIRYRRKRTDNERTKKKHDSKLPNDICCFQTSNRSLDQYQYQMSHFNFIDTDKLPFKKLRVGFHRKPKPSHPVTNSFCKHHAMRVLNSACGYGDSRPIHYNLGYHPHPRKYQQKQIFDEEKKIRKERPQCMAKDEIVEVSPSSFSPVCKSFHDARTGPSKVELTSGSHHRPICLLEKSTTLQNFTIASEYNQKPCQLPRTPSPYAASAVPTDRQDCELKKSQTFQDVTNVGNQKPCLLPSSPSPCTLCAARDVPAQNKCRKKRKKTKRPLVFLTLCNGFLSRLGKLVTDFHVKNNVSGKSCIKYVFFGLLIVVWSPCLLAVILAWVVMFPWKLTNILKTDVTAKRSFPINYSYKRFRKNNLRREYQQMCFENYLPEKKRSFMTSAASWCSRTVGVVVNSFSAVISLLKLKKKAPTRPGSSFLPSPHPNPRKRYKLFYAENRGWVMKPLRRRTRSCARNRTWQSMRCEYRPKFWQKLRCQNLQQASFKKLPCPVHGPDNYPTHQFSPAGDACLVQSRNPCPSCTCLDKCSQRPPAFMPLNSHYCRHPQVNIPRTFYYTTSGIASISTVKTINTKPEVFNSIKITNNISHKKFAKDHLGERTNGPLPFGVVSKGNKHAVGNTVIKASSVHSITSLTDITNHMQCRGLNRLGRHTAKREILLNYVSARSHKLVLANKNSPTIQKKNFSNKYFIFQSALNKKINTSTYKVNNAHKTQNNPTHIPYQKVTNKIQTAKAESEMASKCAREVKLLPPKQAYKYKSDKSRASAQKHPSPVKIKSNIKQDIVVNYSSGNKRKQSKHSYKYKPNLVPVTTQMLLNTVDITTMTNRNIAMNGPCGKEHTHKSHPVSVAIQKQLCTADITTSTNRNVALSCPFEDDRVLSKYSDQHKPSNPTLQPHQIPIATQMQSGTADNATSTKHNVSLNFPCEEKQKISKHGYKPKLHNVSIATKMQLKPVDITTSTNCNVSANCLYKEKHKLSNEGYQNKPHKILVATQMQSRTVENATDMNRDLALIPPCEEKHELSQQSYNHNLHKLTVTTQTQQRTADNATDTNRDVTLNYPYGVRPSTPNIEKSEFYYKYIPGHIFVATQKQSKTAGVTRVTNCDKARNYPFGKNHEKPEKASKCKSGHIPVGTQKQRRTADMTTITKDLGDITQNIPNKRIPHACIPGPPEKDIICTEKINPIENTQKQSYKINATANCVSNYERSKTKNIFLPEQTMSSKKTVVYNDATTSMKKNAPETQTEAFKKITDSGMGGSIAGSRKLNNPCLYKGTQAIAGSKFPQYVPRAQPELSMKDNSLSKFSQSKNILSHKAGSDKEPSSKQSNLTQSQSRISHEQSTCGIASDCTCGKNKITTAEKNLYNNVSGFKSTRENEMKSKFPPAIKNPSISDCRRKSLPCKCRWPVGSLQDSVDQKPYGSKDSSTSSEINIVKVPWSKFTKLFERSRPPKSLLRKCRCSFERLQDSGGKLTYSTKLSNLASKRSCVRVAHSNSRVPSYEYVQQTCPCPVGRLQDPVRKQFTATKTNKTFSKRNCVKVDKTLSKLPKSSEHSPPQEILQQDCTCLVKNMQDPARKKKSQSSRKSVFSRKSKHKSFDFPDECLCSFSQNDLTKISFKSDAPVSWNTTKRFFIRSRESTCSDNELSSRVQSSRISQYSSKVSSLVMNLRSKLISSKSKQTKIPKNPTKKPLPVMFSSLQVEPKKANERATSINDILEFRASKNPSLALHSSHNSCSCPFLKSSSMQCSRKKQYLHKPLIVDKSHSCLRSVAKAFQRPSFLSRSTKYDCRSQSSIFDPRVSQNIISQQSKTSEHSSIVSQSKFDPQNSSTLINCQQTPTVRQKVRSQLPPFPKTLKSKSSSLFDCPQSKVFFEKIGSLTEKITTNTLRDKHDKNVSSPGLQTALIYPTESACSLEKLLHLPKKISRHSVDRATIWQPEVCEQSFQLRSKRPKISKMDSFHRSYPPKLLTVKKQFEVIPQQLNAAQKVTKDQSSNIKQFEEIPQQPKAEPVIPIIPGRCTCAGEQNNIRENSSNKKKLPNTNSPQLGYEKKPEYLQLLRVSNQKLKLPASQSHSRHPTGTPLSTPLRYFKLTHNKPCRCPSFKHDNEQGVSNGLHKIVKNRRSPEKFHKSHLISHVRTCSTTRRLKEHLIQRSEISQSPEIQPSSQIQIHEQNLSDQKRLSKLPTNEDKPPAEMLQQHYPRHGRKSTAEGEVQQPYPDFNRVSMRYPGLKSPPKQSLQIPGINGPSLANNYPPAPGAKLPKNYDPCFTNARRCLPKSPYDECALRRAYKRRPLRYTPPRQQLPRGIMVKKLKENQQRASEAKRRRGIQRTENFCKCLRHLINKTEREVWPTDVKCHPMWLNALKRKPCFCIYKAFPRAYPTFLNCYKTHKYIGQLLVYFITLCFWSPLLLCGYLCCNVLCKCCS